MRLPTSASLAPALIRSTLLLPWIATACVLATSYFLVARGCGYDNAVVLRYVAYVLLYVALPGAVVLAWVRRSSISLLQLIGLALPTGFALESLTFLGLKSMGWSAYYEDVPLLWLCAALVWVHRRRQPLARVDFEGISSGMVLLLSLFGLATVVIAAAQMYVETPLREGLPVRPIFHDWLYLVSRAAEIKHRWPLEDPSLAGTPLQYHYFMLVHTAAASAVTGTEISVLFLRLIVIPLGAVLIVQSFALGRRLANSEWAGILTVLLMFMASEVSFSGNYLDPTYLGIFLRWLFQSPTFYFGMIFFGALVVAVTRIVQGRHYSWRDFVWIALLAAAATGAKGTMIPTLLTALSLLILWSWVPTRQLPWRLVAVGLFMALPFLIVYLNTMAEWGTGEAVFAPLSTFQVSRFWRENFPVWKQWMEARLPGHLAANVAAMAGAVVIFVGTAGLRVLSVPYVCLIGLKRRHAMALWLAALAGCSYVLGIMFHLNSYSQLYVLLLMRLPMAVLAAAFLVRAARFIRYSWRRERHTAPPWGEGMAVLRRRGRMLVFLGMAGFTVTMLAHQLQGWIVNNRTGFSRWLEESPYTDENLRWLRLAMLWVRQNTPTDAVLLGNVFCERHTRLDPRWRLDNIRIGAHFYLSALSERRVWVEGPLYALDPAEAKRRLRDADGIFYRGEAWPARLSQSWTCYLVVDAMVPAGPPVKLPPLEKVYENPRIRIYRVPRLPPVFAPLAAEKS